MSAAQLQPCDCLDWCGDDPRLNARRPQVVVQECARFRERRLQRERVARIDELVRSLGVRDELDALEQLAALRGCSTAPTDPTKRTT